MTVNFALEWPLDTRLSWGQVAVNLLKELHKLGVEPNIFPTSPINLTQFDFPLKKEFVDWLKVCTKKASKQFDRDEPAVRYSSLAGSHARISSVRNLLMTAHELDAATPAEINIVRQQDLTLFPCRYSVGVFQQHPEIAAKVGSLPHGFDAESFVEPVQSGRRDEIVFTLAGKLEKRKRQLQTLTAWLRKYGNRPGYFLNCALFNPFLPPDFQSKLIANALAGKQYKNVKFFPFMQTNREYNNFLNSGNIVLAMSGAEGWGLPEFQAVALGKYCVGLNVAGYQEWMTSENTILVEPNGKEEAYDDVFFFKGEEFNQGKIFTFDDDAFIATCDQAVSAYRAQPVNKAGLELQTRFTWKAAAGALLDSISGKSSEP